MRFRHLISSSRLGEARSIGSNTSKEQYGLDAPQIIETAPQPASASHRLDSIGKSIFPEFRKAGSEWLTGDTYLFIVDMKGMSLFNAGFPKVEGIDLSGLKRFQRQVVVQQLMKTAQSKGSGWVDYMYSETRAEPTVAEMELHKAVNIDGIPGVVGAGIP